MPQILVRASTGGDLDSVATIYAHHVLHGSGTFEEEPPDLAELGRRRAEILGRGLPFLVAQHGGRVVGYAYAAPYRLRSAYRYTLEDSVYVAAECGRSGIGRALLSDLIARCDALGYRQMIAVIGDSSNAASIGLHGAMGFHPAGTLKSAGYKLGRWVDSVLMQRPLGPGDAVTPNLSAAPPAPTGRLPGDTKSALSRP